MNNPELKSIVNKVKAREFSPVYLLHGDEAYYIDQVTNLLEKTVLTEEEKSFNQTVIYGKEFNAQQVIATAKEFPMMSEYKVLIIREAQEVRKNELAKLESYLKGIQPSTVLIICYKYGKLDKRSSFYKELAKVATVLESKGLYENQVPAWLTQQAKKMGHPISMKAASLLTEFLGNDLSKIDNELKKLSVILSEGAEIDTDIIETNIGVSKDFNNFELQSALASKNSLKAFEIINYFNANPKSHPAILTIITLYQFFEKTMAFHFVKDKSPANLGKVLKVNPYFIKEYELAARNYNTKKLAKVMSHLKKADLNLKGVGASEIGNDQVLKELIYKVLN